MKRDTYLIGRNDGTFFVEGFLIYPTWTYRHAANQYSNKRDAIREAKRVGADFVCMFHNPFREPYAKLTVWMAKPRNA